MSYSNSFPPVRPTTFDFANSGKLDSRISFSRADSTPSAVHYWSNEKHLSSENLIPYSNLNSGFSFARTTLASTNNSAPDGGSDAASILETAVSGGHEVYDTFASVSGQQYSFVFYLKANGRTKVIFKPQATSVIANVTFDLTAVTSTVTSGSADSHSITAIGSTGWYKCAATVTATATGTGYTQFNLVDGTGASTYTGEISKGVFAWGASVSSTGQTVVNQTSGTIHREYSSTLKSVANAGDPRFEYSPADGQSVGSGTAKGLLIEAQATNLIPSSDDFSTGWGIDNIAVSASTAIAPDGALSASLLRATSSTYHRIRRVLNVTSGKNYSASIYVKAAGYSHLFLGSGNTSTWAARAYFDLSNGTVGTVSSGTASIEDVGNGYYRCVINGTAGSSSGVYLEINVCEQDNATSFTSNDFGGLLAFGLQFEEGAASSLISTSGASASRAADSCSVDLSQINYSGGEVSLVGEGTSSDQTNYRGMFSLHLDSSNFISLYAYSDYNRRVLIKADGVGSELSGGAGTKAALSFGTNDVSLCVDGGAVTTDTSQTLPGLTGATAYIGSWAGSATSNQINGHIKRVALYNVALSDTELQALTS